MAALEVTDTAACSRCQAQKSIHRVWRSLMTSESTTLDHPSATSIPQTSPERLAQASPDYDGPKTTSSVLYLAYGSNLSAHTFLGVRGIRPISSINISAPAFDLTFDLPGLPYREPCFANIAPRKLPDIPIPIPGKPPVKPPIDLPPHSERYSDEKTQHIDSGTKNDNNIAFPALPIRGPTWSKGLYGVVYEVTPSDYSKIIATEGGGASYADISILCIALPPAIHLPEQPTIPDLKPFFAHTLYAPRSPVKPPPMDKWWQKYLLPVRRAEADYAQPSLRYLRLIREGAAENFLPLEYQEYLQKLEHFAITRRRQEVGMWLFIMLWAPFILLLVLLGKVFADKKDGKVPKWLGAFSGVLFNLVWMSYDAFFKDKFGDGERTMEDEEDSLPLGGKSRQYRADGTSSEKNRLFKDW